MQHPSHSTLMSSIVSTHQQPRAQVCARGTDRRMRCLLLVAGVHWCSYIYENLLRIYIGTLTPCSPLLRQQQHQRTTMYSCLSLQPRDDHKNIARAISAPCICWSPLPHPCPRSLSSLRRARDDCIYSDGASGDCWVSPTAHQGRSAPPSQLQRSARTDGWSISAYFMCLSDFL